MYWSNDVTYCILEKELKLYMNLYTCITFSLYDLSLNCFLLRFMRDHILGSVHLNVIMKAVVKLSLLAMD